MSRFNVPDNFSAGWRTCPNGTRYHDEDGYCDCNGCEKDGARETIEWYTSDKARETAENVAETGLMPYDYHDFYFNEDCRLIANAPEDKRQEVLASVLASWEEMVKDAREVLEG